MGHKKPHNQLYIQSVRSAWYMLAVFATTALYVWFLVKLKE